MNVYVRYFDHENVFLTGAEVVQFLVDINDFKMTPQLENEILSYSNGNMPYPKRIKVRNNVYFILIKTTAVDLPEFKANRKEPGTTPMTESAKKEERMGKLREINVGWYKVVIDFKRMLLVPGTQKGQYRDTRFSAYVYADCALESYNLVIEHLKNRQDIDPRSQFPSEKRNNFTYEFLGDVKPEIM